MRACPVCKQCQPIEFCIHQGVRMVRCGHCASLYHGDEPDWGRIERIYQEEYHQSRGHSDNAAIEVMKQATATRYLRLLDRCRPPGRRLVEVGCSAGAGLEAAARAGWEVEGVELSAAAAELARRRPGVRAVFAGRLEDAPLAEESVDVITMFDVIEHIDPPGPTLARIHRLLRPGGLLLLVTPDGGSLSARMLRGRWPHLFVEHVVMFSRRGMRQCLEEHGFAVERLAFAWKRINLDMLVRHATIHPHVLGGALLRLGGRILPGPLLRLGIPFNIGEFYALARKPG
jgi:SAM-dependent methyltransferase